MQSRQRLTATITLTIPNVLHQHFQIEATKFGMTAPELMVRILETHRFADQQQQHLILAISRQVQDSMKNPS
jgi:hypothetical protein